MSLIWKTNWTATDNYARNGTADMDRLRENLNILIDIINSELLTNLEHVGNHTSDGYLAFPFQSALNEIERVLNSMHMSPAIPWISFSGTWIPYGPAPNYVDINRWEQNGMSVEEFLKYYLDYSKDIVSATFFAGFDRTTQFFSRGR